MACYSRKSGTVCSAGVYHPFFHQTDRLIENHGDDAQENNRQDHPVKFEDLTAVDNEKSKSLPGSDEFTDDHTNQTEPDIDFHNAQKIRDRRGQCHTQKFIFPFSTEGTDELQRIRINFRKAGIQIQDGAEDRNGDPGKDDRLIICTEPYDQQRSQCRLRKAVQNHKVRLQNRCQPWTEPEENRKKETENYDQKETGKCFKHCDPDMGEQMIGQKQGSESKTYLTGASEDKGIDEPEPCTDLPE